VGGNESECVVIAVLGWKGVAVLPVQFQEDALQDDSSVGVVEGFFDIFASPHFNHLLPLPEVPPLVFEFVLEPARLVADGLIVDIFVVDVRGSASPGRRF